MTFTREDGLSGLYFVLRAEDGTRWWKDGHRDFSIPLPFAHQQAESPGAGMLSHDKVAAEIVEAESSDQWTLMHRFNKAAEVVESVLNGTYGRGQEDLTHAMSRVYIWLRYSATRQLTWQRRYNTQPRILSAAQDRLTRTLMHAVSSLKGEAQLWAAACMGTVGRGGDGQKIRDEILNIMHRNKIKEVKGTWMEEWHQKLHNNTTPDDIPICEAYIAFLEANGDRSEYWRVLGDNGITRQRLESFDRAIICEPEYYPDKRDALIKDMYNYLGILKAVHSGADLSTSAANASGSLSTHVKGLLGFIQGQRQSMQLLNLIEVPPLQTAQTARRLPSRHIALVRSLVSPLLLCFSPLVPLPRRPPWRRAPRSATRCGRTASCSTWTSPSRTSSAPPPSAAPAPETPWPSSARSSRTSA